MNKRISLYIIIFCSLLWHCNRDEQIIDNYRSEQNIDRIEFFTNYEKGNRFTINDYAIPFKKSIFRYFEHYREKQNFIERNLGVIDLGVSTQTFSGIKEDNDKLIFFPIVKEEKVVAVLSGYINSRRDFLYSDIYDSSIEDIKEIIDEFQKFYSRGKNLEGVKTMSNKYLKNRVFSKSSSKITEIPGIVIVVPPRRGYGFNGWSGIIWPGVGNGYGSGHYIGGGGSWSYTGGYGFNDTPKEENLSPDPCKQSKKIVENGVIRNKNNELKGKTGEIGENGYRFDKGLNDNVAAFENNKSSSDPNKMLVVMNENTIGYNHTHVEREGVIHMFSPADIDTFISILHNAKKNNHSLSEVFGIMVFRSRDDDRHYVYQLSYQGDMDNIPREFTKNELSIYQTKYKEIVEKYLQINEGDPLIREQAHQLFYEIMDEMGIGNISLTDITNPKGIKNIVKDNNGEIKEEKCN